MISGQRNMRRTEFKVRHKWWRLRIQSGTHTRSGRRRKPGWSDSWRFVTLSPNIDGIRSGRQTRHKPRQRKHGGHRTLGQCFINNGTFLQLFGSTSDIVDGTGGMVSRNWSVFTCNMGWIAASTKSWWRLHRSMCLDQAHCNSQSIIRASLVKRSMPIAFIVEERMFKHQTTNLNSKLNWTLNRN